MTPHSYKIAMNPKLRSFEDILNDVFWGLDFSSHDEFRGLGLFSPQSNSYSFRGQIVDTDRYDIVLKKEFVEKEIANKEDELKSVEETHRKELMKIQQEISVLKRALSPINPQNK